MHKDAEEEISRKYEVIWSDRYVYLEKGNTKWKDKIDLLKNRKNIKSP